MRDYAVDRTPFVCCTVDPEREGRRMQWKENAGGAQRRVGGAAVGIIMVSEPSAGVAAIYLNHFYFLGARR